MGASRPKVYARRSRAIERRNPAWIRSEATGLERKLWVLHCEWQGGLPIMRWVAREMGALAEIARGS